MCVYLRVVYHPLSGMAVELQEAQNDPAFRKSFLDARIFWHVISEIDGSSLAIIEFQTQCRSAALDNCLGFGTFRRFATERKIVM